MGRVKRNLVTAGLSGKVGDRLVFRAVESGETIVAAAPVMNGKPLTRKQQQNRERFLDACIYASQQLEDKAVKAEYNAFAKATGKRNGRAVAVADYLNEPVVRHVNLNGFSGHQGDVILVSATNDYRLHSVVVTIYTPQGTEAERGNAVAMTDRYSWKYTVSGETGNATGSRIVITVTDRPGNSVTKEVVL